MIIAYECPKCGVKVDKPEMINLMALECFALAHQKEDGCAVRLAFDKPVTFYSITGSA